MQSCLLHKEQQQQKTQTYILLYIIYTERSKQIDAEVVLWGGVCNFVREEDQEGLKSSIFGTFFPRKT